MTRVRRWFSLSEPVSRTEYGATGVALMAFKYGAEAALIYASTGRYFSPTMFLNPLMSVRAQVLQPPAPAWLPWLLVAWSLPFLWIAVSMSVRRAATTRLGASAGLVVLVPFVNFVAMFLLAVLPARRDLPMAFGKQVQPAVGPRLTSTLLAFAASALIGGAMFAITVLGFREYTIGLFFGSPVLMGAASAYFFNRDEPRSFGQTLLVVLGALLLTGLAFLLFAAEGVLCLAMLFPAAAVMGFLGACVGVILAARHRAYTGGLFVLVLALPLLGAVEPLTRTAPPLFEVVSTIDIDAPPEQVWPHVIGFSDLPPPPEWYFDLGIAYPQRATIGGSGAGAVRHCEFSTGPFVEPITDWDPPHRLAFSVASQPPPMHELSPYKNLHPPHLDGYLRSKRGEFRLLPLPGGRTRLEGSTWYELDLFPHGYWTLWSDAAIHAIHMRVLRHIQELTEAD